MCVCVCMFCERLFGCNGFISRFLCSHSDDPKHICTRCTERCARLHERCGHPCRRLCWEACAPCMISVTHTFEPCQHSCDLLCSRVPTAKCMQLVTHTMPVCGHTCNVPCHALQSETATCTQVCGLQLACGHMCTAKCADCTRPKTSSKVHVACRQRCTRPLACGHLCDEPCHGKDGTCSGECKKACATKCVHR